jgi:hypothetical protein
MRFTWLTYRRAIRRSFNREYALFCGGIETTAAWRKQMRHTWALEKRRFRERAGL